LTFLLNNVNYVYIGEIGIMTKVLYLSFISFIFFIIFNNSINAQETIRFGQQWENNGVLLNVVAIDVRTSQSHEAAALQVWFYFFNYSGQRILIDLDWDSIYVIDNHGNRYRDWEGGTTNRWVDTGTHFAFSRYYTINRGERSRVPSGVNRLQIIVNNFSRIQNISWEYYINPILRQINRPPNYTTLNIGQSAQSNDVALTLTNVDIRTDQSHEAAAVRAWFSIVNNSNTRKLLELNFFHIFVEDSFGRQFIDWEGGVTTIWLEPRQVYNFSRYYSEMSGRRSRMTSGSRYILIKTNNFSGIRDIQWGYDITY